MIGHNDDNCTSVSATQGKAERTAEASRRKGLRDLIDSCKNLMEGSKEEPGL